MELIPLDSFDFFGLYWFNKNNSLLTFHKVFNDTERSRYNDYGYASIVKSMNGQQHSVAVYFEENKLFLQINQQRWDLFDHKIKLKLYRYGLFNNFKLLYDNEIHFECKYWSRYVNPVFYIDKLDDTFDMVFDGIFSFIVINYNDKENVISFANLIEERINRFNEKELE